MSQQTEIYAGEFDESVRQYNESLVSLENPGVHKKNRFYHFIRGMGSVLDFFGTSSIKQFRYFKEDLTSEQKDAIALASDWQRVDRNLDQILSGNLTNGDISVEDATQGKQLVQQMYEHFKNVYVANAVR